MVGPLLEGLEKLGDHRVLVMCDHLTPVSVRTHTPEPVPFVLYDSRRPGNCHRNYSEAAAQASGLLLDGAGLLPRLLEK